MTVHLVCIVAGLGIEEGQAFPVTAENGSVWEILLGGEYRKVNKRSCRVQGWKDGPRFGSSDNAMHPSCAGIRIRV